jgi:hypothetical protein
MMMCSRRCSTASEAASRPVGSIAACRTSSVSASDSISFSRASPGSAVKLIGATSVVGSPPSAVIFSTRRVASSSSDSECSRIFCACAWYSRPMTLPATSE